MKKTTLLLSCIIMLVACTSNETTPLDSDANLSSLEIAIEDIDNLKSQSGKINSQLEKFKLGKTISGKANHSYSIDKILNKEFINVSGFDIDGNTITYRQEVQLISKDKISVLRFIDDGTGETCKGVKCSHCVIKEGGGCDCKSPEGNPTEPSYCNHTVTSGEIVP